MLVTRSRDSNRASFPFWPIEDGVRNQREQKDRLFYVELSI